jgi:furin-like protease 2
LNHISLNLILLLILFFGIFFLKNKGGNDGYDMNVVAAWKKGYTGKGVVVTILDDGIQSDHPDLSLNYVSLNSIVCFD